MPERIDRRTLLKAAGVSVTAGLAGCTRGGTSAPNGSGSSGGTGGSAGGDSSKIPLSTYENADIEWKQFEGSSINIGAVNHPWVEAIKPVVPVFEELTGIDVQWSILPEQQFRTKRLTDVSTGAGKFDLFFMDQVVNQFRKAGWLQPLDPYFKNDSLFDEKWYKTDDLLDVCVRQCHGAGRADSWTGMPITVEVLTQFYRKDLYEKHGLKVADTTAQLRENAKVIHENEDGVVGCVGRGQKGYGMNIYIQNAWIREWGTRLWKDYPTNSALDSKQAIAAGNYYVHLLRDYGPPGIATYAWPDVVETMRAGKTGHIVADANLFWGSLTDPQSSQVAEEVDIAKMPVPQVEEGRFAPNAFTWQVSTSKAAENSKEGFLFLVWATSQPTQNWISIENEAPFPTRESVWSNPEYRQVVGKKFADVSLESLKHAIGDPFDPQYPEWGQAYSVQLQQAIAGEKSVTKAFETAARKAENIAQGG